MKISACRRPLAGECAVGCIAGRGTGPEQKEADDAMGCEEEEIREGSATRGHVSTVCIYK